jgi:hypothetical protein
MRNLFICLCVSSLLVLPSCANMMGNHEDREEGNEVKVTIDQVPAAARKTIEEQTKGGKREDIGKITADGRTIYETDVEIDGKEFEVRVAEDGTLLSRTQENDTEGGKDKEDDKETK